MRENRLRELWQAGRPALGGWCMLPDSFSAQIMANAGVDWVCVDMQHGLIGYQQALSMLQAVSTTRAVPLVRVPGNDAAIIGKCLDAGARGVIIPMVNSREEAAAAAAACRYAPDGVRSYGPLRVSYYVGFDYYAGANEDVLCIPMVETREAVNQVNDIASVPGVDAIFVGPADLSITLGLAPAADQAAPKFTDALECIVAACRTHGVQPGIAGNATTVPKRLDQGFTFVEVACDAALVGIGAMTAVGDVRPSGDRATSAYL